MDLTKYPIGRKAFIYKHLDHYIGPEIITSHIGTRSMVIRLNDRDFQRDAGMVLLEKPKEGDRDPTIEDRIIIGVQTFTDEIQLINPLQEEEFIIVKGDSNAHDWYCAEIRKVLADRIEVNYYTTITPPLERYTESNPGQKRKRLKDATFLRTWCLDRGTGLPTTTPPASVHGRLNHLAYGGEESHWKTSVNTC